MKIMSVDFGDVRTGLAVCDRTEFLATPVGVIKEKSFLKAAEMVSATALDLDAQMIVVGYPKNMDGSKGSRAKKCEDFAKKLEEITNLPVEMWDERCTTIIAHKYLSENEVNGKKRKEVVDEVAAAIILEDFMKFRKNNQQK